MGLFPHSKYYQSNESGQHRKTLNCKELKERFLEQGYNSKLQDKYVKIVEKLDKNELIKGNKKIPQ